MSRKKKRRLRKSEKEVVHLPRHLRTVHKNESEKAKNALSTFDLRANNKPRKENARMLRRRVCPYPGCSAVVRKLHNHLIQKHKVNRNDKLYKDYLKIATLEQLDFKENEVEEIESISSNTDDTVENLTPEDKADIAKKIMRGPMLEASEDSESDDDLVLPTPQKKRKVEVQISRPERKKKLQRGYAESEADSFLDDGIDPEWINLETSDKE